MQPPYDTVLPADSVEFCPHPSAAEIFVCGTYKLEDAGDATPTQSTPEAEMPPPLSRQSQKRIGKCLFFEVKDTEVVELLVLPVFGLSHLIHAYYRLPLEEISLPAILDMKWFAVFGLCIDLSPLSVCRCHTTEARQPLLAIADSECNISLHEWNIEQVNDFS
jgi:diphthamide biosynthesis protein 7